jgi:AcrR family transcriptional regulator
MPLDPDPEVRRRRRQYRQTERARSAEATRARIIAAARELIPASAGSLPVGEIARHAGVAVQTIYDQFGSKGGLLMATVNDVQRTGGLLAAFGDVFSSSDGESAMRRMLAATVRLWHTAWPFVAFTLRARRIDPVVASEMDNLDLLRFAHFGAIVARLDEEGRLRPQRSVAWATTQAFALSTATVYEELAVRRRGSLDAATATVVDAVLGLIIEPGSVAHAPGPPDWPALEAAAARKALRRGARVEHLTPSWYGGEAWVRSPGDPPDNRVKRAAPPRRRTAPPPD